MNSKQIIQELQFKAVRSSGAGGQHVNKVSTKIVLYFDIESSRGLTNQEKERLVLKLQNRLNRENQILLSCDASRSQHKNKEIAIQRFLEIIKKGLHTNKTRRATKPTQSSIKKRLENKQKHSTKKGLRKRPAIE